METNLDISFTTATDDTLRSQAPCTQAASCLQTATLQLPEGKRAFSFYANYPVYENRTSWEALTRAIIVVHGANRNASDYYNYVNTTLGQEALSTQTLLIAPHFKQEQEAGTGELYWSGNGWRDGQPAVGTSLSSFAVLDSLLARLAERRHFPALTEVLITGHSSGGLFTHVYGATNQAETAHPEQAFTYLPANSQYYYYPNEFRLQESNGTYVQPADCATYDTWPMGYRFAPAYVQALPQEVLNTQYLSRNITYLLGNGTGSDGTLNTTDCRATWLGTTRYQRGENAYAHTQAYYPGNAHQKRIVEGIGHNGLAMYQSATFRAFLAE